MMVGAFVKALSQLSSNLSPVRLTLFNHLVGDADLETSLGPEHLQNFILDCLDYPHWFQNRAQLGQDLKDLVERNLSPDHAALMLQGLRWPQHLQVLEIEHPDEFQSCVQKSIELDLGKIPCRYIYDSGLKKILALILHPNRNLEVRFFDRKFLLWDGELRPLKGDRRLVFNSDLELAENISHKVEIAPYVTAKFQVHQGEVRGNIVRGYIFQRLLELKGEALDSAPKLFYFIRKIENHFLKRESNPFFVGLVAELEKHIQLLRLGDEAALSQSADLVARAQNALEYVFGSDKLLSLLIRDLQNTLNQAQVPYGSRTIEQTSL